MEKNNQNLTDKQKVLETQLIETNKILADLFLSQNQLEATNQAQVLFFANISHELRNPLNAILGFSQVIKEEVFGPLDNKKYKEYIDFIFLSASHLLSLVNNLLDLSKIQANKMHLYETRVSLKKILTETVSISKKIYPLEKRFIRIHLKNDVILKADEKVLRQIFLNILSNAIKFTVHKGRIDIFVNKTDFGVQIIFKDNGIGISKEKQSFLFQPFTQIENDLTDKYNGSGLGLVLVKKMVILHQGRVQIKSLPKKGTSLVVDFPFQRIVLSGEKNADI